jgi:hypothetical protein
MQNTQLFVPEQPKGTFYKWAQNNEGRIKLGKKLKYTRDLMKSLFPERGLWLEVNATGLIHGTQFPSEFPWVDHFIKIDSIQHFKESQPSPFLCQIYFEKMLNGDGFISPKILDLNIIKDEDPRLKYFRMINNI